ncbi:MAG: AAA family ATPase [Terriglobales bacterium]
MRKWQRDRNRRRKKPEQAGDGQQPRQEPLQPIYPDMQPAESSVADELAGNHAEDDNLGNRVEPSQPAAAAEPDAPPARKRRRRGRGGRGRGTAQPQPEVAQQPAGMSEVSPELPSGTPAAPASKSEQGRTSQALRTPRGIVVLTIGLPGSGKSSWFKRRGVTPLSSDLLRTLLFDNITEQKYQDLVFGTLRSLLRARLIARMPWNYVDATNLSPKERAGWIKMSREFGYDVHAVFFDVPIEVCKARNLQRARMVPDDVMDRFAQKLRPPTFDEGFSKIIVVRVKKRDDEPTSEVL